MEIYPHSVPIILTDAQYILYGGHTGSSVAAQRQAAYLIAEKAASEEINTLLLPTIVTGTFLYNQLSPFVVLDYTYVHRVINTTFIDVEESRYWSKSGTDNNSVSLRNGERGLVDIHYLIGNCSACAGSWAYPYQVEIVYEAGLPTGVASQSNMLLALTTYADIIVNEIIGYGNESPGDIGVKSFSNQQYSEQRVALLRTSFGTSARAQFAKKLINSLKRRQFVGL
jgi:hypothetical protein